MRSSIAVVSTCLLACLVIGLAPAATPQDPPLPDDPASVRAYAIGFDLGRETANRLEADRVDFDLKMMLRGVADGLARREARFDHRRMQDELAHLEREVSERHVARRLREDPVFKALHDENLRRSRDYLQRNASEPGFETLPTGVQRKVLGTGTGRSPGVDSVIIVNFHARLADGYTFGEGRDAEFRVAGLVEGVQRLITRMREGDHWSVVIPPENAFGVAGRPPDVGPNEVMLLDVELLEVRDQ